MNIAEELERSVELGQFLASRPVARARLGATSHRVIHRQGSSALRYFPPARGAQIHQPLFISTPLINGWAILDLLPGRSLVGALSAVGVPVYLLDWGVPGASDRGLSLGALIDQRLPRALSRATRHARAEGHLPADGLPAALGYCVGGTFLAMSLARHPGLVDRMALLATPIDFSEGGLLNTWADPERFPVDALIDDLGAFPKELMREAFAWLRPMAQLSKWRSLHARIHEHRFAETWAALERWSTEGVDFPGEAYRAYVHGCYFDNALMGDSWMLDGRPLQLKAATIPARVFAATSDHICPPAAANGLLAAWGGPVEAELLQGGHVSVCLSAALPARLLSWIDA